MLDPFAMVSIQEVRIDIGRARRRRDPLIAELGVALRADLEGQRERLVPVSGISSRRDVLHGKRGKPQLFPVSRNGGRVPHDRA
jgi:hypothetical protein